MAQVGAYRIEPVRRRIRVNEHAVAECVAQVGQIGALERGGSGGDEAVVVVGVCDETVYRVEESERCALLVRDLA